MGYWGYPTLAENIHVAGVRIVEDDINIFGVTDPSKLSVLWAKRESFERFFLFFFLFKQMLALLSKRRSCKKQLEMIYLLDIEISLVPLHWTLKYIKMFVTSFGLTIFRLLFCTRDKFYRFNFFSSTYTNVWMDMLQMA